MKVAMVNSKRKAWDGINNRFNGQAIKRAEYIIKLGRIPNPNVLVVLDDGFWNRTRWIRGAVTSVAFHDDDVYFMGRRL